MTALAHQFGTPTAPHFPDAVRHRRSAVHHASLALVWLALATSGVVFAEPAPVDVLLLGLVLLLPLVGLVAVSAPLLGFLAIWLTIAAAQLVAAPFADDVSRATIHTVVSLYLSVAAFVLAAFVARSPVPHLRLLLNGYLVAAVVATAAALIGYFALLPGAYELFTRFDRAAGTFKDPNVLGAFLVAPAVYCVHLALERRRLAAVSALAIAGLLMLGIVLSFSRGAWINLALALAVYGYLSFVTAGTNHARLRIVGLALAAAAILAAVAAAALQNDAVSRLIEDRATLTQSYDVGPEGRFGGQAKALRLISEHPLGLGSQEFAASHHHEEVHNVYLSMALNGGWIGGALFIVVNVLTVVVGFRSIIAHASTRPLLIVVYAAFVATALEGLIIDSDHWRHLYVLMAMVWGISFQAPPRSDGERRPS